ncbi:MAG: carboxylesterase [Actinomycetota bacterium]|nr:carboxylesterase [Actinomycetota bacterium]
MQELKVLEGAEEFTLGSGRTGALLVHGFTGSPQSMRPLGEHLAAEGLSVVGIRLPGHGTTWEDLNIRRAEEWTRAVDEAFEKMKAAHDEVFLVGLSFGGTLVLDCAERRDDVAGVVTLAGMVHSNDPRRFLAPAIRYLAKSLPGLGNDICDPDARELCYDRLPTSAAYSVLSFTKKVRSELKKVTAPILVMHGRNDHTVHPGNATMIHEEVSSKDNQLVWMERSYHVITLDYDRDEVERRTSEFIKERARSAV